MSIEKLKVLDLEYPASLKLDSVANWCWLIIQSFKRQTKTATSCWKVCITNIVLVKVTLAAIDLS